ncbi:MAG: HAD family hydrolase [Methanomicrobiales archaeon]|nr:HAD family hydrolase [Methanomicrobiales archaeon]
MSVAVVFDSAGTLLRTFRVAKEIARKEMLIDVETTLLTFTSADRVLVVLHAHSRDIMAELPPRYLSEYLREKEIGFGIACSRRVVTADSVRDIIYSDRNARIGDLQECIRTVWEHCRSQALVAMDSGAIVDLRAKSIEYVITSGGKPFPGAKETITDLHRLGIPTFIASGDRAAKLEKIADHLGIFRDRVFGIATPQMKARIIDELKTRYDVVVMVGDGINDLAAFTRADLAILTEQQRAQRPRELYDQADFVVKSVSEVVEIVGKVCSTERDLCARESNPGAPI